MSLSQLSIRKPVFAWMLMAGLLLFGSICYFKLGISQMPDVDFPTLTITVQWTGASPETMELAVTDVIESAVMGVEGIQDINSSCQEGLSTTTIEFNLNKNIDSAFQEVQAKLVQAQKTLPLGIDPPIVSKSNPEDDLIMWGVLTGQKAFRDQVLFMRDILKDCLMTVHGVGEVSLASYADPNMRIWLDPDQMKLKQITVEDIINAIQQGNSLTPSGHIEQGPQETNIRVFSGIQSAKEVSDLYISNRSGIPVWKKIRIGEVALVKEDLADFRRITRMNGKKAISFAIVKQRGFNVVSVVQSVKNRIQSILDLVPKDMKVELGYDVAEFIKSSTHELLFTLCLSALLTSIVCWIFLGSFSSAFNVLLAIPTSLIGSLIVFAWCKFTINTITLLALSLSIGIIVDDAIMVLENIVSHQEKGLSRMNAALKGSKEITGAAVASSVAILAIFIPVLFMKGIIGKFFYQFGIVMTVTVMLSLLESLTLAPMRCSQFLNIQKTNRLSQKVDEWMEKLSHLYKKSLSFCLHHRVFILMSSLLFFTTSLFLLQGIKQEFVPSQDQNQFLLTLQTKLGSSLEFTEQIFIQAEEKLKKRLEVNQIYSVIGGKQGGLVNQGFIVVNLKKPKERPVQSPFQHQPQQNEIMNYIRDEIKKIPELTRVTAMDLSLSSFSSKRSFPIDFTVQGSNWEQLAQSTNLLMKKMNESGLMTDVDTNYNPHMPEIQVHIDREKALKRGVTPTQISDTISAMVGSLKVGKYTSKSGHRDDIRIKLFNHADQSAMDIQKIWIRNNRGEMISLSEIVTLQKKSSLLINSRRNREKAISIYANVAPHQSQAATIDFIKKVSKESLPEGDHVVFSGNSQIFQESFKSLCLAMALGIVIAYMFLGAQFNSFIHPIPILLALPFSTTGAFLALWLTGISLNIYSMIGILLLMGIVKKNSILLVHFTNIRREKNSTASAAQSTVPVIAVYDALLEACPTRLRAILMTSIATIAAALPAALAIGPGAEVVRPMAVVVIGGVLLSTFLTLFVVPCAYSLLSRFEKPSHFNL